MKMIAVILVLALLLPVLTACGKAEESIQTVPVNESESDTIAFFKSLDYKKVRTCAIYPFLYNEARKRSDQNGRAVYL